jgi:hypothetical protein
MTPVYIGPGPAIGPVIDGVGTVVCATTGVIASDARSAADPRP